MSKPKLCYFKNSNTAIVAGDNEITSIDAHGRKFIGVIPITSNIDIELGRPLAQYEKVISIYRMNIIFVHTLVKNGLEHCIICKLSNNGAESTNIGTVVCKDGIIVGLFCNDKCKLANSIWSLKINNINNNTKLLNSIKEEIGKVLFGEREEEVSIKVYNDTECKYAKIKGENVNLRVNFFYTSNKTSYRVLSIKYLEEN